MLQRVLHSQLRINMASGMISTAVNMAVLAIGYPIYLHFLGREQYGLWLTLSVVVTVTQLGNLGMGPAVTKLVAEDYGRGDINGIARYIATAVLLVCLSGSCALAVVLLCKNNIVRAFRLSPTDARTIVSLMPYAGVLSVYVLIVQVLNSALSGLGRLDLANYIQTASRIVGIAAAVLLLSRGLGLVGLLIGSVLSHVVIHTLSWICIRRVTKGSLFWIGAVDRTRSKRLLRFGSSVLGGSLIYMLFDPFNRVMLSRYAGLASIPMCDIAFTGSLQVKTLIETGLRALMPEVSRLNGVPTDGTRQRINELYHQAMRLTLCVGVPLYAVLIAACPVLLRMWLRDGFMEGLADVFRITLAASLISLLVVPSWYILLGLGFARCTLISYAICVSVHLVCVLGFLAVFRTVKPWYVAVAYLAGIVASSTYIMDQRRHRCQESQRVVRRGVPRRANHDQRAQWL